MGCTIKRNWILGGYSADFSLTTSLDHDSLPKTIDGLVQAIRHSFGDVATPTKFNNVKGRDCGRVIISELPSPQGEEILTLGGTIATGVEAKGSFTWSPFRFSLLSHFDCFEGSKTIVYLIEELRTDSLPPWLPWWLLARAAPIRIEYARCGFEIFTSRFKVSQFGFMPVVSDSLLIDISHNMLTLSLSTEQPKWRPCNPFNTIPLFASLAPTLTTALGTSIAERFKLELAKTESFPD